MDGSRRSRAPLARHAALESFSYKRKSMVMMMTSVRSGQELMHEFWTLADTARTETEYLADAKLQQLANASLPTLQRIFVQYRYFTIFYITDLALLVARLPFGRLRSLLADFLNDELGNGDNQGAHERLYDDFLLSIGLRSDQLELSPNRSNLTLLNDLQNRVKTSPLAYAVGLRGMGGECLCQVYLSAMHSHFKCNTEIRSRQSGLAWKFWDIHTGEVDIAHREKLKAAIHTFVTEEPAHLADLVQGYKDAKHIFDSFWDNIYAENLASPNGSRRSLSASSSEGIA